MTDTTILKAIAAGISAAHAVLTGTAALAEMLPDDQPINKLATAQELASMPAKASKKAAAAAEKPAPETPAPAPTASTGTGTVKITRDHIKAACGAIKGTESGEKIKAFIKKTYGVDAPSAVPEDKLEELLDAIIKSGEKRGIQVPDPRKVVEAPAENDDL